MDSEKVENGFVSFNEKHYLLGLIADKLFFGYRDMYDYFLTQYLVKEFKIKGRVLDIGCGRGRLLKKLSKHIKEGIGIDINTSNSKFKNISFFKMNASNDLPFEDNSFDFVLCFEVLEHIRNDGNLIKNVRRILKQKGYFIISTPHFPVWNKYNHLKDILFKKSGHKRLGYYESDFFLEGFDLLESRTFFKNGINQFVFIKGYALLPILFFYIFIVPVYTFLTFFTYLYDKYSNKVGADIFIVLQRC